MVGGLVPQEIGVSIYMFSKIYINLINLSYYKFGYLAKDT